MTAETFTPQRGVKMTPKAVAHTQTQLHKRPDALGIRLGVRKSGCSGFKYETDWVESQDSEDEVFEVGEGVKVFVRRQDLPVVNGTEIDYITEGLNSMFFFRNPNATAECGCGESFAIV